MFLFSCFTIAFPRLFMNYLHKTRFLQHFHFQSCKYVVSTIFNHFYLIPFYWHTFIP